MGHGPAYGTPGRDDGPGSDPAGLDFDPRFDGTGAAARARAGAAVMVR